MKSKILTFEDVSLLPSDTTKFVRWNNTFYEIEGIWVYKDVIILHIQLDEHNSYKIHGSYDEEVWVQIDDGIEVDEEYPLLSEFFNMGVYLP
jgi:hypothetical protein